MPLSFFADKRQRIYNREKRKVEMIMEEILRLQIPVFEENLPKEILLRSIVVVICVFVLGIFAQTSSTEYRNHRRMRTDKGFCQKKGGDSG